MEYSPFEAAMGVNPRKPIDLLPYHLVLVQVLMLKLKLSISTFWTYMLMMQCRIAVSNDRYKPHADLKTKFAEFKEGDEIMVCI